MDPANLIVADAVSLNKGAGFWIRAAARIIDTILLTIVSGIIGLLVGLVVGLLVANGAMNSSAINALGAVTFWSFVWSLLGDTAYHAIGESMHGATLGKLICGLHVLRPDGSKVSFGSALGRSFAFLIDGLFFGMVGYSSMRSSELRQRYGDKWTNTIVVRRTDYAARQWPSAGRFVVAFLGSLAVVAVFVVLSLLQKLG